MTVIDEFSRRCLAIPVARRLNSEGVLETLAELMTQHGVPAYIRSDNGAEFTAGGPRMDQGRSQDPVHRARQSLGERLQRIVQRPPAGRTVERRNLLHAEGSQVSSSSGAGTTTRSGRTAHSDTDRQLQPPSCPCNQPTLSEKLDHQSGQVTLCFEYPVIFRVKDVEILASPSPTRPTWTRMVEMTLACSDVSDITNMPNTCPPAWMRKFLPIKSDNALGIRTIFVSSAPLIEFSSVQ